MVVKIDMNIPPRFFDSAHKSNDFESVSEKVAKAFISQILGEKDVIKGNPDRHEPDYLSGSRGFEVTFAIESSLVPQLKGVRDLEKSRFSIEDALVSDVLAAARRKSEKTYSCVPSLFIITMSPLFTWFYPFYIKTNYLTEKTWSAMTKKRDILFDELYSTYIDSKAFENILIVLPTHDEHFILFDVHAFGSYKEVDFMKRIGVNNPKIFPTCKTTYVDYGNLPVVYEITIIRYTEDSNI
ncbi:MAG: hypothetical protein PHH84_00800 [Oscillospiraceae bacterium]|nr:hypothetical protein [Oscillospiraceae bacterium]MDD4414217.1 hypothetical protein [Oscillospiraceae bacterium]